MTIYHGDATEILPKIKGVDMVFTSPPYNQGGMSGGLANLSGGYDTHGDQMHWCAYQGWQRQILALCWETLTDTGAIFYNHKQVIKDGVATLPTELNPGLPLRQIITWYRKIGMNWSESFFVPTSEMILVMAKRGFRLKDKSASNAGDVWEIPPNKNGDHPASFPEALPSKAIGATDAKIILDPFMGSGTTLRAAKNHNRKAIGIEISERYCEQAAARMSQGVLL